MVFHVCGCVTLLADAGRVSPGVFLEIGLCRLRDKLHRRSSSSSGSGSGSGGRCVLLSAASPGSVSALPLRLDRLEDLSGPAVMMRAFCG